MKIIQTTKPLPLSIQIAIANELRILTIYNPGAFNTIFII